MRKILNQIAVPRVFVLVVVPLLVLGFILAELMVLGQAYVDTHANTKRDALLVEQMLQKQTSQISAPGSEKTLTALLGLEGLSSLENLTVDLVAEDGRVLDSNHPGAMTETGILSRLMMWLLDKPPAMISIVEPVTVDDQVIGNIVIKNNFNHEVQHAGHEAVEIVLPWLLLFVLCGFALAQLLIVILTRLETLLTGNNKSAINLKTVFSLRRLSIRLTDAIDAVRNLLYLQKRKVVDAQETERKRIASELHDELGQHLTAMRFELDKICLAEDATVIKDTASSLRLRSERMSDILRSNLELLRPPQLDEYGIGFCVEQLVNDWCLRHPDNLLSVTGLTELECLDRHGQLIAYRIIQECLTNISRHAGNKVQAEVLIQKEDEHIVIQMVDDGLGCDMNALHGRYGLLGMRERVDAISGQLLVRSQKGEGMQVRAMLPMVQEK